MGVVGVWFVRGAWSASMSQKQVIKFVVKNLNWNTTRSEWGVEGVWGLHLTISQEQ